MVQVMYAGTSLARTVIREHEFYFPKGHKKISGDSKQDRIKFDVLLTSYEMINLDTAVLKPIKWKCMVFLSYFNGILFLYVFLDISYVA